MKNLLQLFKLPALLSILIAPACFSLPVSGAVIADITATETDSTGGGNSQDNPSLTFSINAATTTNSMIAVFLGMQDYNTEGSATVTLDDQAMTRSGMTLGSGTNTQEGDQIANFYYLPTQVVGSNEIVITTSDLDSGLRRGLHAAAFVLENVDENQTPVFSFNPNELSSYSVDLTPAADGSAVIGFLQDDGGGTPASTYFGTLTGGFGNGTAFGTKENVSATLQTLDFNEGTGNTDNTVAIGVSFSPIPEPSSAALILLGLGALAVRRRRHA